MKKWYAVIGDPIAHSLSPVMHETWFKQNGIDASYIAVRVEPADLSAACDSLLLLGASGFNVTLPHKQAIIPLLSGIDETAGTMNAVNTVIRKGRDFVGINTDGDGFVQSLLTKEPKRTRKILVIGAGGAARGICFALGRAGFKNIAITNRTYRRAQELAEATDASAMTIADAEEQLGDFDIVIQTTSVGLDKDEALPLSISNLSSHALAADIVYNPIETPFLKAAEEKGCRTLSGVGMFVYQGAIAFEQWTGVKPDTEKMIQLITETLGGNYVNR